jgi:hypothetical protein
MAVNVYRMAFEGKLLKRGFWLYVWEVKGDKSHHVYVGRTGDSSSANASSPFRRIGQHLDPSLNAKGNALGRRLREAGLDAESCSFEMTAIGPLFEEQETFSAHSPLRDKTAALERALADELRLRGYEVLGVHPRAGIPDSTLMEQVTAVLDKSFPPLQSPAISSRPRFQPIRPKNGESASEIILRDRGRL